MKPKILINKILCQLGIRKILANKWAAYARKPFAIYGNIEN